MRVTDDRYSRDRLRLDLAIRMIRHEARTCTIRSWTGLTDDRIRKLYKTYIEHHSESVVKRHRGKSPRQIAFFLRNLETRRQTAALAGLFGLLGMLHGVNERRSAGTPAAIRWGDLFCAVYETYQALHTPQRISFEHAWFLLHVLRSQQELSLEACPGCDVLMVVDKLRVPGASCAWCETEARRLRGGERDTD